MINNNCSNNNDWKVTNDSVMGGLSIGNAIVLENTVNFSGKLSTANSGGFTSIFKNIPPLAESNSLITIVIKGDGKAYQLRVKTVVMGYELAYKTHFQTQTHMTETHTFLLSDFVASHRGRVINNAPILKANTISHVGFLLSAKVTCDFSLIIYSIDFS